MDAVREVTNRTGRPRLPASQRKRYRMQFLATIEEADRLFTEAYREGLTLSMYVRRLLGLGTNKSGPPPDSV